MSQRPCSPFSSSGGCPTCVGQCRCLGPQLTQTLAGQTRKLQAQASPGWLWGGEDTPGSPSMERARTPAQPLLPEPGGVLRELAPCRERGAAGAAPGASFLGPRGCPGWWSPSLLPPCCPRGAPSPFWERQGAAPAPRVDLGLCGAELSGCPCAAAVPAAEGGAGRAGAGVPAGTGGARAAAAAPRSLGGLRPGAVSSSAGGTRGGSWGCAAQFAPGCGVGALCWAPAGSGCAVCWGCR